MHAATSALKVHYVELLVQEGVKSVWTHLETLGWWLKHFLVHVWHGILRVRDFEKLTKLFVGFLLRVKVHLCWFLQFLVRFMFHLSPSHFFLLLFLMLFLEKSWPTCVYSLCLSFLFFLKLMEGLFAFFLLSLEDIKIAKVLALSNFVALKNFSFLSFVAHYFLLRKFRSLSLLQSPHFTSCLNTCLRSILRLIMGVIAGIWVSWSCLCSLSIFV